MKNRDKLALRRQSIRTLTASELRIAHGGDGGTGTGNGNGNGEALLHSTDREREPMRLPFSSHDVGTA